MVNGDEARQRRNGSYVHLYDLFNQLLQKTGEQQQHRRGRHGDLKKLLESIPPIGLLYRCPLNCDKDIDEKIASWPEDSGAPLKIRHEPPGFSISLQVDFPQREGTHSRTWLLNLPRECIILRLSHPRESSQQLVCPFCDAHFPPERCNMATENSTLT